MWDMILQPFRDYAGSGMLIALFLAAEIFLFVSEKNKMTRIVFVYLPGLVLLLYFLPPFAALIYAFVESEIYYRLLWLLPITPVLGYTAVKILSGCAGIKKWGVGAALGVMIMLSGSLVYRSPLAVRAENPYHVPQPVVDICDAIRVEGREVMAAFPMELVPYVRQYSPYVCMPYGREILIERWHFQNELYDLLNAEVLDVELIVEKAREQNCHYVVFGQGKTINGSFEDYEYELFDVIDGYTIYTDTTLYKGL